MNDKKKPLLIAGNRIREQPTSAKRQSEWIERKEFWMRKGDFGTTLISKKKKNNQ